MQTSVAKKNASKKRGWSVTRISLAVITCCGVLYVVAMGFWLQRISMPGSTSGRWFESPVQARLRREYELSRQGLAKLYVDDTPAPEPEATLTPVQSLQNSGLLPDISIAVDAYPFAANGGKVASLTARPVVESAAIQDWVQLADKALNIPAVVLTAEGPKPLKRIHDAGSAEKLSAHVDDNNVCVVMLTTPRQGGKDFVSATTKQLLASLSPSQKENWDFFLYNTEGSSSDMSEGTSAYLKHVLSTAPKPMRVITRQSIFPHLQPTVWDSMMAHFHTPDTCGSWWWPQCNNSHCPAAPSTSNNAEIAWELKRTLDIAWALQTCATSSKHSLTLLLHDDVWPANGWAEKMNVFAKQMSDMHDGLADEKWSFLQLYHADRLDRRWWNEYPDFRAENGQRYPYRCCSQAMLFRSSRLPELARSLVEHVACRDFDGLMEAFQRSCGGDIGPPGGRPFVLPGAKTTSTGEANSTDSTSSGDGQDGTGSATEQETGRSLEPTSEPFLGYVRRPALFQHIGIMSPGRGASHVSYTWEL